MVQDMLDPEFYLGKYYTVNRKTNEKVTFLSLYFLIQWNVLNLKTSIRWHKCNSVYF